MGIDNKTIFQCFSGSVDFLEILNNQVNDFIQEAETNGYSVIRSGTLLEKKEVTKISIFSNLIVVVFVWMEKPNDK